MSLCLCASVVKKEIHLNHRGTEAQRGNVGRNKSRSIAFPSASLCEEFLRSDMQNTPRFWVGFSGIDRDRSKELSGGREGTEPSGRDRCQASRLRSWPVITDGFPVATVR